jgi:ubiquinone/menaquinone biosynthesis C-methylase UbiE
MNFDARALTWDDEYRVSRAKVIAKEIEKWVPINESYTALEFGCGTGLISFNLYNKFEQITLIDNSRGMIDVVNSKIEQYKPNNMIAYEADIQKGNIQKESYDVIYTSMVLHHIEDIETIVEKLFKMLNNHGYLCIVDLVKEDGEFHKEEKDFKGHHGFEEKELKVLLEEIGFEDINSKVFYNGKKSIGDEEVEYSLFIMVGKKK